MAYFDPELDMYVVRVVYDGPPMSGKTTSLRTLARLLGKKHEDSVFSPGEVSNRTLFFDWLDYKGGLYNGKPIRCQIVSVPGQKALEVRRQALLESADAIIFVLDSAAERYRESLSYFRNLLSARSGDDAPGVLLQANKRDLPDAIPLEELTAALDSIENVGVVESTAIGGDGVRQSFVLGVGLALDRIALLESSSKLRRKSDEDIESGTDLLDWLREEEGADVELDSVPVHAHQVHEGTIVEDNAEIVQQFSAMLDGLQGVAGKVSGAGVLLPSTDVPAGLIWPPVAGRLIVNDVSNDTGVEVTLVDDDWVAQSERWTLKSREQDVFDDATAARLALIGLVKNYIRLDGLLSGKRSVAIAGYEGNWRLWQIARAERSVASVLESLFQSDDSVRVADLIFRYGQLVVNAAKSFRSRGVDIPVEAISIGAAKGNPVYLGWIPAESNGTAAQQSVVVEHEIRRTLGDTLREGRLNVPPVIDRLNVHAAAGGDAAKIVDAVSSILIGH